MSTMEHKHDENCHHEEEMTQDQMLQSKKGEKTFIKFMKRFHLNQMKGVTRVIIKTGKGFVMYADNPTIMIADNSKDAFVVFGEIKYLVNDQAKGKQSTSKPETKKHEQIKEEPEEEEEDDTVEQSAEGLDESDIAELISYANCSRNKAI